jgi:thiosulfate reductase cytochrome b subunit
MVTGLLYWLYNDWAIWNLTFLDLRLLALIHLASAFAILTFIIVHLYMTTTGHTLTSLIVAMITGWEEVEEGEVADWEIQQKP